MVEGEEEIEGAEEAHLQAADLIYGSSLPLNRLMEQGLLFLSYR